jgi:hypothetical protein
MGYAPRWSATKWIAFVRQVAMATIIQNHASAANLWMRLIEDGFVCCNNPDPEMVACITALLGTHRYRDMLSPYIPRLAVCGCIQALEACNHLDLLHYMTKSAQLLSWLSRGYACRIISQHRERYSSEWHAHFYGREHVRLVSLLYLLRDRTTTDLALGRILASIAKIAPSWQLEEPDPEHTTRELFDWSRTLLRVGTCDAWECNPNTPFALLFQMCSDPRLYKDPRPSIEQTREEYGKDGPFTRTHMISIAELIPADEPWRCARILYHHANEYTRRKMRAVVYANAVSQAFVLPPELMPLLCYFIYAADVLCLR